MGSIADDIGPGMEMLMREYESSSDSLGSALSGIEELGITMDESPRTGSLTSGAAVKDSMSPSAESLESFPFNDSVELFLAKKVNESAILTIETSESSANASALEEPDTAIGDDVTAAFPQGYLDQDLYDEDESMMSNSYGI